MPRVVVVNNYSLDRVSDEVERGDTPDQYLYGINYFSERGYEVEIAPISTKTHWYQLQRAYENCRGPIPVGNLEQQMRAWEMCKDADLVYAPCQTQTYLLSYLKALGIFKTPMVCLAHQPLNPGRLGFVRAPFMELMLHGVDAYPALSSQLSGEINAIVNKSIPLAWGPQQAFYPKETSNGETIVVAGRTGRDFLTFAQAASRAEVASHVVCLRSSYSDEFAQYERYVKFTVQPDDVFMPFPELVKIYASARAIAIPLHSSNHLNGLSSLVDALAMGKPIIMTRNRYIDVDIEGLGIGRLVEANDQDGWVDALKFFDKNPDAAVEMGLRARALVDAGFNSQAFANQVMDIFDRVLGR